MLCSVGLSFKPMNIFGAGVNVFVAQNVPKTVVLKVH